MKNRRSDESNGSSEKSSVCKLSFTIILITTTHTSTIDPYTDPELAIGDPLKCKSVSLVS